MRLIVTCAIFLLALMPGMAQEKSGLVASPAPQQTEVAAIPDAATPSPVPDGQQSPSASTNSPAPGTPAQPDEGRQTEQNIWIVPNFRAVSAGVGYLRAAGEGEVQDRRPGQLRLLVVSLCRHPGRYQSSDGFLSCVSPGRRGIRPILLAHLRRPDRREPLGRRHCPERLPLRQPLLHAGARRLH